MQATKPRTADAAIGRWPGILMSLGIDERFLRNKHGPCPNCGGKDRYRFDDKEGRGTWHCSQCGAGNGFQLLELVYGWDFKQAAKEIDRVVGTVEQGAVRAEKSLDEKLAELTRVWNGSRPVLRGDPVWTYLNSRLGVQEVPPSIRFHPGLRHPEGTFPAMVSRMTYPDGSGASLHRTFLTPRGEKAPVENAKLFMPGRPLGTASVRLSPVNWTLGIAEGIETALAASARFQVPCWAATNAVLLEQWQPPNDCSRVIVYGDNDASFTGQSAAHNLARRLVKDGYDVHVEIPPEIGKDWADDF